MADTAESRPVASRKRSSLARWLEANTSATLPLLISVVALGAGCVAVVLAHRGSTTTATASSPTPLLVPLNMLNQYGWKSGSADSPAGYYKGSDGRIYLTGTLRPSRRSKATAFVLPGGYRPSAALTEPVVAGGKVGTITVQPTGGVVLNVPRKARPVVTLDGVSFLPSP